MIRANQKWVLGPFQVAPPDGQRVEDREEFLLGGRVIALSARELSRLVSNWPTILQQHCPQSFDAGIGFDHERLVRVWQSQYRSIAQFVLEGAKCGLTFWCPIHVDILPCLFCQGRCYSRVVLNELAKIVCETQEAPKFGYCLGSREGIDRFNFLGVYLNSLVGHNVAQVLHFLLEEGAL